MLPPEDRLLISDPGSTSAAVTGICRYPGLLSDGGEGAACACWLNSRVAAAAAIVAPGEILGMLVCI